MSLFEKIIFMHFRCNINENTIAQLLDFEIRKSPLTFSKKYKNTRLSPLIFVTNTIVTEREQIYKNKLIEKI